MTFTELMKLQNFLNFSYACKQFLLIMLVNTIDQSNLKLHWFDIRYKCVFIQKHLWINEVLQLIRKRIFFYRLSKRNPIKINWISIMDCRCEWIEKKNRAMRKQMIRNTWLFHYLSLKLIHMHEIDHVHICLTRQN